MALPKIETPSYTMVLPSREGEIKFRPFTVREEKILMMASETGEQKDIVMAMSDVIESCTYGELKCKDLPVFDLEYIFLQIRAKSVGEIARVKVICPDDMKTYTDVEIDLTKVDVQVDDAHTNDVKLDEGRKLGVVMRYPNMKVLYDTQGIKSLKYEDIINIIIGCVEYIYEGDKNYPTKDSTREELKEFFENLSQEQFSRLRKFFDTMPKLRHETKVKNPKTGVESTVTFSGLQDFFGLASPTTA